MNFVILCLLAPLVYGRARPGNSLVEKLRASSIKGPENDRRAAEAMRGDYSNVTQGDIRGEAAMSSINGSSKQRNAIYGNHLWWNAHVPCEVDTDFPFYDVDVQHILNAMNEITSKTCITFGEKTATDVDYVRLRNEYDCSSQVGRRGGPQDTLLGSCMIYGNILHELVHAVGFYHEQSRNDRDTYVEIHWWNVMHGSEFQFMQHPHETRDVGNYDYGSIMHYPPAARSFNGLDTIVAKNPLPPGVIMGQLSGLSAQDVQKLNSLYGCVPHTQPATTEPPFITAATAEPAHDKCERNLLPTEIKDPVKIWPMVQVPVVVDPDFSIQAHFEFAMAMAAVMEHTCIEFMQRHETTEKDYIQVLNSGGCGSQVGRKGTGRQDMYLGREECQTRGTMLHYLVHALGFYHETGRSDRDTFVQIIGGNVETECAGNLRKENASIIDNLRTAYDYGSIMHPPLKEGSKNGQPTVRTLKPVPVGVTVGQRTGLSATDIIRINRLYECLQDCNDTYSDCNAVIRDNNCPLTISKQQCRMTCGHCKIDPPPEKKPTAKCKDTLPTCKTQFHKCKKDATFTNGCRMTCDVCN